MKASSSSSVNAGDFLNASNATLHEPIKRMPSSMVRHGEPLLLYPRSGGTPPVCFSQSENCCAKARAYFSSPVHV